jgi:RNA polymerase sigma factor (sigma-70 family)
LKEALAACDATQARETTRDMDRDALRLLYERYSAHVYGRCRFLLKDEDAARDAVQDVFLKAMDHGSGFRNEAQPSTWLIRIATNHCLNVLRMSHNKTRQAVADGKIEIAGPQALWGEDRAERRELVRQLLSRVDDECAAVAIHYFVDEMTQEEIGAAVGRSLPTVRKRLREFLEAAGTVLGIEPMLKVSHGS